jgi:hypothetical protein
MIMESLEPELDKCLNRILGQLRREIISKATEFAKADAGPAKAYKITEEYIKQAFEQLVVAQGNDLIFTATGNAVIPIRGLAERKVVKVQIATPSGKPKNIGVYSLMDLLKALNGDDKEPVRVEFARLGAPSTSKENSDGKKG